MATLGICLGVFLGLEACRNALGIVGSIFLSIGLSYLIFADLYCIISGSYIGDIFLWASHFSFRAPGIIFTWDLDGIKFLILMKILFAITGFLVGAAALAFGIALSGVFASISFPFVLIHNIGNNYADAL